MKPASGGRHSQHARAERTALCVEAKRVLDRLDALAKAEELENLAPGEDAHATPPARSWGPEAPTRSCWAPAPGTHRVVPTADLPGMTWRLRRRRSPRSRRRSCVTLRRPHRARAARGVPGGEAAAD